MTAQVVEAGVAFGAFPTRIQALAWTGSGSRISVSNGFCTGISIRCRPESAMAFIVGFEALEGGPVHAVLLGRNVSRDESITGG